MSPLSIGEARNPRLLHVGEIRAQLVPMRPFWITLFLFVAALGGLLLWLQGPVAQTTSAALKAYPVYSIARTRNDMLLKAAHEGAAGSNHLRHRPDLAGPRDRTVTTPNNDTLYASAFLDLASGPVRLKVPALPGRYHSVAIMDARTDNVVILGTRDGGKGGDIVLAFGEEGAAGGSPPGDTARRYLLPSPQAWLLIRTLVDGPDDLAAAQAAQQGFQLTVPDGSRRPPRKAEILPVLPDPATLLRAANPLIAESPHLRDASLAQTGYGGDEAAFQALPVWRQWIWRLLLPRLFARLRDAQAQAARNTGDGWSKTPEGMGTAQAADGVRAGVALAGLGALPATEAVYWSAVQDRDGEELDGAKHYRLTIPADVPAEAFWSLSLYERTDDGRLFYVENPLRRYAVSSRAPGFPRNPDGSLTLTISSGDPGAGANWLPSPPRGPFTLVFRAYRPGAPIRDGRWRLPPVQPLPAGQTPPPAEVVATTAAS